MPEFSKLPRRLSRLAGANVALLKNFLARMAMQQSILWNDPTPQGRSQYAGQQCRLSPRPESLLKSYSQYFTVIQFRLGSCISSLNNDTPLPRFGEGLSRSRVRICFGSQRGSHFAIWQVPGIDISLLRETLTFLPLLRGALKCRLGRLPQF